MAYGAGDRCEWTRHARRVHVFAFKSSGEELWVGDQLKRRLGGLAYVLTGISRFAELSANRGSFRAEGFSWEGPFVAVAIGNGRQAGSCLSLTMRHAWTRSRICYAKARRLSAPNWLRREARGSSTSRRTI